MKYDFKKGYGGPVISTLDNSPPNTIYPDSNFKIAVKIENQGAYEISNGKIKVMGFDEKYIELEEKEKNIVSLSGENTIKGKSYLYPEGETTYIEFDALAKGLFPGEQTHLNSYYIKAEYDYKTELSQTVCVNPRLYDVYDSGCKVTPSISSSGQGSPLAISAIEEIVHPGAIPIIEFRFNLRNVGRGEIKRAVLNQAKLADKSLDCDFKNNPNENKKVFEFKKGQEATLICKKLLEDQKSYETVLFVDISFTYAAKENKMITLKK